MKVTPVTKKQWPWWVVVAIIVVTAGVFLSTINVAQSVVDARATRCEAMMDRLSDPGITVGEVERLRIENGECYPGGWPGLLQPQSKEKRAR